MQQGEGRVGEREGEGEGSSTHSTLTGTQQGSPSFDSTQRMRQRSIAGAPTADASCMSYASISTDAEREILASTISAPTEGSCGDVLIRLDGSRTQWPTWVTNRRALAQQCSAYALRSCADDEARWQPVAAVGGGISSDRGYETSHAPAAAHTHARACAARWPSPPAASRLPPAVPTAHPRACRHRRSV